MFNDKTFLQNLLEEELQSFIKQNTLTIESIKQPLSELDGSFIFEIGTRSTTFNALIDKPYLEQLANLRCTDTSEYTKQLGTKIIKVEVKGITEVIKTIIETKKLLKEVFAGALIINKKSIINPFHPLVAPTVASMLGNATYENTTYKVIIYTYTDVEKINTLYSSDNIEFDVTNNIDMLIRLTTSKAPKRHIDIIENTTRNYSSSRITIYQKYKVSKLPGENEHKEYYIIASQLLTHGTFVPYYGSTIVSVSDKATGFHVTPMKSCNISDHTSSNGSSVCTGSKSNRTVEGLRTLHHANLSSAYQSHCMTPISIKYANACIEKGIEVYNYVLGNNNV